MKIFIGWSGDKSQALAEGLRHWLPTVIQSLKPWVSSIDVGIGTMWPIQLAEQIEKSDAGIFCLTKKNIEDKWIFFEAGAIWKAHPQALVCTYLLDIDPLTLTAPLSLFQGAAADKTGTKKMLDSLNTSLKLGLRDDVLDKAFERSWSDLDIIIAKANALP